MADVYQNAHLVIAASGASSPGEGCFSSLRRGATSVAIPHYDSSGCRNGFIWVALTAPGEKSPAWGPLNERGWALQEWRLARRTLHFMPSGLSWNCRTQETGERYPFDMQQYPQWDSVIQQFLGDNLPIIQIDLPHRRGWHAPSIPPRETDMSLDSSSLGSPRSSFGWPMAQNKPEKTLSVSRLGHGRPKGVGGWSGRRRI